MSDVSRSDSEQLILYAIIAIIGSIPVVIVLMRGGVFGSEATVGLLMLLVAVAGLGTTWRLARMRR